MMERKTNEVKYIWRKLSVFPETFAEEVNNYLKQGFTLQQTIVACDCIVQVLVKEKPLSEYTAEEARIYNEGMK